MSSFYVCQKNSWIAISHNLNLFSDMKPEFFPWSSSFGQCLKPSSYWERENVALRRGRWDLGHWHSEGECFNFRVCSWILALLFVSRSAFIIRVNSCPWTFFPDWLTALVFSMLTLVLLQHSVKHWCTAVKFGEIVTNFGDGLANELPPACLWSSPTTKHKSRSSGLGDVLILHLVTEASIAVAVLVVILLILDPHRPTHPRPFLTIVDKSKVL